MTAILMQMDVDAPVERVWSALSSPDGVRGWWTSQADVDVRPGGVTRLSFPDAPMTWDLRTEEATAGRRLRWRCVGGPPPWVGTDIVFELDESSGATRVRFDHSGWEDAEEMVRIVTFGWGQILPRLSRYAATGRPDPFFAF
jgi:uncharacterized protein YndB with AHSA1/START domain